MTTGLLTASYLKQKYSVSGHFYSLDVNQTDPLMCRSVLEISSRSPISVEADAVFVMMNPGASRPVKGTNQVVRVDRMSAMAVQLVPAVPDPTQYQIMRIMHGLGWDLVRVINLSDLCNSKSGSFIQRYAQVEAASGGAFHSIFSATRAAELRRTLARRNGGPVVRAWGVSNGLDTLIERAAAALASEDRVTGLEAQGRPGKYFHPLPPVQRRQMEWVQQLVEQLRA